VNSTIGPFSNVTVEPNVTFHKHENTPVEYSIKGLIVTVR
jgi:hypothetical protein